LASGAAAWLLWQRRAGGSDSDPGTLGHLPILGAGCRFGRDTASASGRGTAASSSWSTPSTKSSAATPSWISC